MSTNTKQSTNFTVQTIVLTALFIAISVVLGKALEMVPNVELISFSVWMSTYVLERKYSTVVGIFSFSLHSILSPYGVAPLPLLISQALGGGLIGFFGGWIVRSKKTSFSSALPYDRCLSYLAFGLVITLVYDVLTNLGGFVSFSENSSTLLIYLLAGLTFGLIHIVSNGIIFMVLTPLAKQTIDRVRKS